MSMHNQANRFLHKYTLYIQTVLSETCNFPYASDYNYIVSLQKYPGD